MIHHFARAFFTRSTQAAVASSKRAEPIDALERTFKPAAIAPRRLRISSDPADARRTVIAGRFADVCAALDRLVLEQEAAA